MSNGMRSGQEAPPAGKALLLRVGMDRGTGGALGPIFPDGTFEYIPIPEASPTRSPLSYASLPGRHVSSLACVLPARLAACHPHIDPDFSAATYGDAAPRKRQQLVRLAQGDRLVFYVGLMPPRREDRPRLFAIGSLDVRHVHHLKAPDFDRPELRRRFGHTAHFLREPPDQEMALVEGDPETCRLFARARPLGDGRDCLLRDLARLGYRGSLRRAVGHWLTGDASLRSLDAWLRHGSASLIDRETRLIPVAASALRGVQEAGDLVIADRRPREGDWILARCGNGDALVQALARVNRLVPGERGPLALSSLFWLFSAGRNIAIGKAFPDLAADRIVEDTAAIRELVSWVGRHSRIGFHRVTSGPEAAG